MNSNHSALEARLQRAGKAMPYPATPDVAERVARQLSPHSAPRIRPLQRVALALLALLLVLVGLLAVPTVRASILEFLEIGAVRILLGNPAATSTATPAASPAATDRPTATPQATETPIASLHTLAGETTLEDAQARSTFTIRLPTYPPDLGAPDHVYKQDMPATTVVLVWLDETGAVEMSLHILTEGALAYKIHPASLEETTVHGERALWTTGPYWLQIEQSSLATFRLIDGHTLIWAAGLLTYRLETDLPIEEAVRVAESLE